MSTSITTPLGSGTTRVQLPYGGASPGAICSEGVASQKNGEDPSEVWGKIIAAGGAPPATPPVGSIQGVFFSNRAWRISKAHHGDIPAAQCSSSGVNNRLVIWTRYPNSGWDADEVTFSGVCSNRTECDQVFSQYAALAAVPAEAPQQMQVEAAGFMGEKVGAFNGAWALTAKKGARCVWNNGRDRKKPRVELRLDLEAPNLWQLTFQIGRTKLVFHQSNLNWSWSRANELLFTGGNAERKGAPVCVRVSSICCD